MKTKPALFMLVSRFPYPLEKGDKLRAYHQLKELRETYDVHLFALSDQKVDERSIKEVEKLCASVEIAQLRKAGLILSVLWALFTGKPFQVAWFYRFSVQRRINERLDDLKPDFVYCQLVRVAEYVKNYHRVPKTLDYMDALSAGMSRRASKSNGLKKLFFRAESERLKLYERSVFDYFEHRTMISAQDGELILHPDRSKIVVVPNGVDTDFFHPAENTKPDFDLLFTGNFSYAPNVEAAEYLVKRILPELNRRTGRKYSVLLAGATPAQRVRDLASEQVSVSGWLEDIREAYWSARIFVAPLFIGTGLQNKLLEALACGLPIVTTPLTIRAFGEKNQIKMLLAEDLGQFVEKITALENDMSIFTNARTDGPTFVSNNYSWSKQNQLLSDLIRLS